LCSVGPFGSHNFDGWSEAESAARFDSVYTERCLAASFEQFFGAYNPQIVFE